MMHRFSDHNSGSTQRAGLPDLIRGAVPRRLTTLLLLLTCVPVMATDRALLIGVDEYANPGYQLQGVDYDLRAMRVVAGILGFADTTVLHGADARYRRVVAALKRLATQSGPRDRVLVYFTSHGVRVPDSSGDEVFDHKDDALVLYDYAVDRRRGGRKPRGLLVDDELSALLADIPAHTVLLIVDACHSGTMHKSLDLSGNGLGGRPRPKVLWGMEDLLSPLHAWIGPAHEHPGLIALMAAGENEETYVTAAGSIFTQGLAWTVIEAQHDGQSLNARDLLRGAAAYVNRRIDPPTHPRIPDEHIDWRRLEEAFRLWPFDRGETEAVFQHADAYTVSAGAGS